jgi:hypothetical protein
LIEDNKVDGLGLDFLRDLRQVEDRTRKSIEPRDYELVAVANKTQCFAERRSLLSAGTASLLFEDSLATMSL